MTTPTPDEFEQSFALCLIEQAKAFSRCYVGQQDYKAASVALLARALEHLCKQHGTPCRVIFGNEEQE